MKSVALGSTGLSVSAVCLGCMSFGADQWRAWVLNEPESLRLLGKALDGGINFFDTANVYSGGMSERVLGKFLKGAVARDKVVVSTKAFYETADRPGRVGLDRENVMGSLDSSLKRLGMDYVDIYQVHRWDDATPIDETMQALADVVKAGKARFVGASNMRAWHLAAAQLAAQRIGFRGFATMQHHYNLLYREDERDLIPFCRDQAIGLMCWSPLARGRLARAEQATARSAIDDVETTLYGAGPDPIQDEVAAVAQARGASRAEVALAWTMAKGIVPVVGVTKDRHIDDALAATTLSLNAAEIAQLERAYTPRALSELPWNAKNQTNPSELAARLK
ncbi:MAG: aldo/keto reductase [Rhodospirillaceae bacterium]|nr:aldo/keto reductase [Rhodospirillaceae bacterium]